MKKQIILYPGILFLLSLLVLNCENSKNTSESYFSILAVENENGNSGIRIDRETGVSFENLKPVSVELFVDSTRELKTFGYDKVLEKSEEFVGMADLQLQNGMILKVSDQWIADQEILLNSAPF